MNVISIRWVRSSPRCEPRLQMLLEPSPDAIEQHPEWHDVPTEENPADGPDAG